MSRHLPPRHLPALILIAAVLLLAGCSTSAAGSENGPSFGAPTATATPAQPTPTLVPTTCAQLAGFSRASSLTLSNMELPQGTIAPAPRASAGGTGKFTIKDVDACTANNSTDLMVNSGKGPKAFTALLPFYGWASASTFPGDGQIQKSCGSAQCFVMPDEQHYLELSGVTAHPNKLITFHLRIAAPPPAPTCDPLTGDTYQTTLDAGGGLSIPLPPLTRLGMSDSAAGSTYVALCSAGTASSVKAFLQVAAPAYGWQSNGSLAWKRSKNGLAYTFDVFSLTSATDWTLRTHPPM